MARMRFRLSTLLILFTFLAVTIGLGYQIFLLKQQVANLNGELTKLKQSPTRSIPVYYPLPAQPGRNSSFRLLKTEMTVNPAIEDGMKAGEWELQKRRQQQNRRDEIRAPEVQTPNLEGRLRGVRP